MKSLIPLILFICVNCSISTSETTINVNYNYTIPTVNYFPYIYNCEGKYKLPCLNLTQVNFSDIVQKQHVSIVMETEYIKVTILPEMGRVYSIYYKTTGHEVLWKNDIARPGGANNDLGWWLWIGGIEYTLPGEEHGFTWALKWDWKILYDTNVVVLSIVEPTTGLVEELHLSTTAAVLKTKIRIYNPSLKLVAKFAHWTNVPMVVSIYCMYNLWYYMFLSNFLYI